jgi:hypothetical protein
MKSKDLSDVITQADFEDCFARTLRLLHLVVQSESALQTDEALLESLKSDPLARPRFPSLSISTIDPSMSAKLQTILQLFLVRFLSAS